MAADCAIELKKFNVAMISLYPGAVKTELVAALSKNAVETEESRNKTNGASMKEVFSDGESTEFSGKVIVSLAQGKILFLF
jgi:dehydrogenase/reductase SDR family member 1